MAFDQSTRNRLQRLVSDARALLTQEFTRQVQHQYGMDPATGEVADVDKLSHMDDTRMETARLLRDTLNHYLATSPSGGNKETLERIVREQAFTVLNRLAALRMMEARGLLIESVARGYQSKGFQLYQRLAGSALGETGDAYRCYVFSLFDEFALDLPVLFDRFSPQERLFPREAALLGLLDLINHPEIETLWAEDETIGWIYQYYNSQEERRQMRADSPAPRDSRELAVRNQFFTPRYVVEFLTDNTLGRLWYEMTQGQTGLTDQCRYLVRRPNEIFLQSGEEAPMQEEAQEELSQEELLKQPVYIPFRTLKDPREIRMLDPACGSMHFGLYAFDLFEVIYDEAWEIAHSSDEAQKLSSSFVSFVSFVVQYFDKAAFLADVPRLIIEHNLHGIDIDPRAVQIAGLSLWLRAQRTWQQQGLRPQDRPSIRRSNIVCAEPMPGEEAFLEEFIGAHLAATPERKLLGQLVRRVFDAMKLAGEAGSLLKIEEEIAGAVAEAKQIWLAAPKLEQGRLFADDTTPPSQKERSLDVTGITDETFWEKAEERIYAALQSYSEQAEHGGGYQRRLFADDAARGFAFIALCRKRYDVVLMNPPFGEPSAATSDYLQARYPTWNQNLLCAFIERGWSKITIGGATAAIFDRTAIVKSTYEEFRRAILIPDDRISTEADLGWEVLDANVEVTTCVLSGASAGACGLFFDVRSAPPENKGERLLQLIVNSHSGGCREDVVVESSSRFASLPNAVIGYDFPSFLRSAFSQFPSLEVAGFKANQGFALKADKHFRTWWELDSQTHFCTNRMFNGAGFAPYATALLDYAISPVEPEDLPLDSSTRKSGIGSHRLPGVCFGKRGEYFCAHVLPAGHIFTVEGQSIPVADRNSALDLVAYLNTALIRFALNKYCGQHKYSGYVNLLPFAPIERAAEVRTLVIASVVAIQSAQQRDEVQSSFAALPVTQNLWELGECLSDLIRVAWSAAEACEAFCDLELTTQLGVAPKEAAAIQRFRQGQPKKEPAIEDADVDDACAGYSAQSVLSYAVGCLVGRWDIRFAMGEKPTPELPDPFAPLPVCPPGQLQNEQSLPITREDVTRLKEEDRWNYPIEIPWDGILVDDPGHPLDFETRVHQVLQVIWKDRWEAIEREACEILGVRTLRDYFYKPAGFFADHLKRYSKSRRKAPIYWPLQTPSGSSTLWLYYHRLNDQTLYTCVNDFVEKSKLHEATEQLHVLRTKTSRSKQEENDLERLLDLEQELKDFRDELLRVAKFWKPNLNDGVQITAAPLWKLFQHKPWQKTLKETWDKLEDGDYDWAHLAYSIWPNRVRDKCRHDKSLAIAHGLEDLYEAPPDQPKKKRGRARG